MHIKKSFALAFTLLTSLATGFQASAQEIAVKTNLLSDAFGVPSVGAEMALAPKWTAELTGEYCNWNMWNDQSWKHWTLQSEARYWFCDRWLKFFVGGHVLGGEFNAGIIKHKIPFTTGDMRNLDKERHQGWFIGGGIGLGYDWILSEHFNLEAEIGVGYIHSVYDKFKCYDCKKKLESDKQNNYVGPTKAAINLLYLF